MKRYSSIALLIVLIAPALVTYSLLRYQKKVVKHEVKWRIIDGIDKEELVLLKFTKSEKTAQLEWKHAKEFKYNHQMYDIVETREVGDTTYYWCWWDHDETKLNKQLSTIVLDLFNSNPANHDTQNKLHSFFKTLYCNTHHNPVYDNIIATTKTQHHSVLIPSSLVYAPPTPPPQTV